MRISVTELMQDMSVSFWLKDSIRALNGRDPVDALADAELLVEIMKQRLNDIQGGN